MNIRKSSFFGRAAFCALFSTAVVCVLATSVNEDRTSVQLNQSLDIQFSTFSPAYAAMEDEYLFAHADDHEAILVAGDSQKYFQENVPQEASAQPILFNDALTTPVETTPLAIVVSPSQVKKEIAASNIQLDKWAMPVNFAVNLGPVTATVVATNAPSSQPAQGRPAASPAAFSSQSTGRLDTNNLCPVPDREFVTIRGAVELAGGLAFLGALEVSWVVNEEEIIRGTIDMEAGKYEMPVKALEGQIYVSLYDEDDSLVGEGVVDLDDVANDPGCKLHQQDIVVSAVQNTLAGKIRSIYSLGTVDKPVANAKVSLFGMDVTSETNAAGEYHFGHWHQANSKSVALVSKTGYWDSLFLLDSNKSQQVLLFPDTYMNALVDRLLEMGMDQNITKNGFIFGAINHGQQAAEGVVAEVDGYRTVYFRHYLAMEGQEATDSSGLFTIVGLSDGDHQLNIYKDGKLLDQRIVVVEGGRISPIEINLQTNKKNLQFFDPLSDQPLPEIGARFFDGEYVLAAKNGEGKQDLSTGTDPALLEFAFAAGEQNNMIVSRSVKSERVPVVNRTWLNKMKSQLNLTAEKGVAVGFLDSKRPFRVAVAEEDPAQTFYFDRDGSIVPMGSTRAIGFIFLGMQRGLHTILIGSPDNRELYLTDLVYNDHASISVIYKKF